MTAILIDGPRLAVRGAALRSAVAAFGLRLEAARGRLERADLDPDDLVAILATLAGKPCAS